MEWCDGTTLRIPNVQKLNEGSYQCVISNCAGSQISSAAKLSIGKNLDINQNCMKHLSSILLSISCTADPPQVNIHPKAVKNAVPGQTVTFTVQAIGTEPIKYLWQWKSAGEEGESEDWQLCDTEWCSGNALSVPKVQKLNEGSYQCIISNCAGFQISKAAKRSVGMNLDINTTFVVVVVVVLFVVAVVVFVVVAVVVFWILAEFCFLFIPTADPSRVTTAVTYYSHATITFSWPDLETKTLK